MYTSIIVLFLAIYSFIAAKKLDWAVMLILAGLPAYLIRFEILGIPFTLLEGMILSSFLVWLLGKTKLKDLIKGDYGIKDYLRNSRKRTAYPFGAEVILVIVIAFSAAAVSGFDAGSLGIWKAYFFEPILLFILVLNVFQDAKGLRKIILSLAVGALAVSVYAVFQKLTGIGIPNEFWARPGSRRVTSFFGYPNAIGLYLAPLAPLFFSFLYKDIFSNKRNKEKMFLAFVISFLLLAVFFARSEGALVGIAVSLFIFGFFVSKTSRIIMLGFCVVLAGALFFNQPIREYAVQKASLMDLSGQIRRQQWKETWQMLNDGRLMTGAGLDNYQKAILPYHQEGIFVNDGDPDFRRKIVIFDDKYKAEHWQPVEVYLYPHNFFLNFWTELGLAGTLVFSWIFIRIIYSGIRNFIRLRRKKNSFRFLSLGLSCAILSIMVHGLVDVPYFKNDLSAMFWTLAAISGVIMVRTDKIGSRSRVSIKRR